MTKEQVEQWKHERDIARGITDEAQRSKAMQAVYDLRDDMMMHCIQRQADRIKMSLENDELLKTDLTGVKDDVSGIKEELKPLKETDREYRDNKLRFQGAAKLWSVLKYVAAIGGGTLIPMLISFLKGAQQ